MLESLLDPIFKPLLAINPPIIPVIVISLGISLLITFIYKWSTDQELMKSLKAEMKKYQKEMKALRDDPQKMLKVQQQAMAKNMEYMKHSMKSTLFTMLPIILIFGYLNSHFGYFAISPNEQFETFLEFKEGVTGEVELISDNLQFVNGNTQQIENNLATWELEGEEGSYILEYKYMGQTYTQDLLITTENKYETPVKPVKRSDIKTLNIGNEKLIVLNLFGWKLGWLGTYIIFSIIFSTIIRKVMNVH